MLDKPLIELSEDFQFALDELEQGAHLFITGKAGTGKSTLLQLFRDTTEKNLVVLAPTGIAALNVKGQTIHSFFGLPPKPLKADEVPVKKYKRLYQKLDCIVIDEISMVRADMIDTIDIFMRLNGRNPDLPFGGVQLVFFGDLFQLPPVVKREEQDFFQTRYGSPYFFSAEAIRDIQMDIFELTTVYRQEQRSFVRLLDRIRTNSLEWEDFDNLNTRFVENLAELEFEGPYITLSARNDTVDKINQKQLEKLTGPEVSFTGSVSGNFNERLFPAEMVLRLREGAQVMFIKNDANKRFVNGSIGIVKELKSDGIKVELNDPKTGDQKQIKVARTDWEVIRHKLNEKQELVAESVGSFTQYPLRLAWAITIHKSQGKTFDRVIIDLGKGAFAHGQTYVALSRCTTLEGIILKQKIRPSDIRLDPRIIEFYAD
ncbi:MAG: AAA family ATPase [Bacteroidota bacterium]